MENVNKNIIYMFYNLLNTDDNNALRQISQRFSRIIGPKFFTGRIFSAIHIIKYPRWEFRYFVHKYNLFIDVKDIKNNCELTFFNTLNVKSISLSESYENLYSEYLIPATVKEFDYLHSNKFINPFPSTLESLTLYEGFKGKLKGMPKIKSLKLSYHFNNVIDELPPTLEYLETGYFFDQLIDYNVLPDSLLILKFGREFNQIIYSDVLPPSLTSLEFGDAFDKFIGPDEFSSYPQFVMTLPDSLLYLKFGENFNQPLVQGSLPPSLLTLHFDYCFDQPLCEGLFPNSLTELTFGYRFNKFIDKNVLPQSLLKLKFGEHFNNQFCKGSLPNSLISLKLSNNFNCPLWDNYTNETVLPDSLLYLNCGHRYNRPFDTSGLTVLPSKLLNLKLGPGFKQTITPYTFPSTLEKLKIGYLYLNSHLRTSNALKKLKFLDDYSTTFSELPIMSGSSLNVLILSDNFNRTFNKDFLPQNLKVLRFGNDFNKPIVQGILPNSITSLTFGYNFDCNIQNGALPSSLIELDLGSSFNKPLSLPSSLKKLKCGTSMLQMFVVPEMLIHLEVSMSIFRRLCIYNINPENLDSYIKLEDLEEAPAFVLSLERLYLYKDDNIIADRTNKIYEYRKIFSNKKIEI